MGNRKNGKSKVENWKSYIKLCSVPDVGSITAMRLLEAFGSPEGVFAAPREKLLEVPRIGAKLADAISDARQNSDCEKIFARMGELGAKYIHYKDPRYPRTLLPLADKPVGFYCIGECDFNAPCIAIVGSRRCSIYGQTVARKFAATFARAGFVVVSGMARGIDTYAHLGALEAGGKTVAVLGCGVDVVYPPENLQLYERIKQSGAVISEFKLGARADRQTFPIRNRIVSGMSLATVVVESDVQGGSMITARLAAEQGRDVFAVPGRIDSHASRGCNTLIREGATLAMSADDIIEELRSTGQVEFDFSESQPATFDSQPRSESAEPAKKPTIKLSDDEAAIIKIFDAERVLSADEIAEKSAIPVQKCLALLLMLEIKKVVKKSQNGWILPA